jgi:hypothetical protein
MAKDLTIRYATQRRRGSDDCTTLIRKSIVLLWYARLSNAQVLTGTLFGTVKDESGGVLPEASVSSSSPALIGDRSRCHHEKGSFGLRRCQPANTFSKSTSRASPSITRVTFQLRSREAPSGR